MTTLAHELDALPQLLKTELARYGFDPQRLLALASSMGIDPETRNRLSADVTPPQPHDLPSLPPAGSSEAQALEKLGLEALNQGQLAFLVMAGGMATRMGGLVKALVPAVGPHSFLDLRLGENAYWSKRTGHPVPLWLMSSYATDQKLHEALDKSPVRGAHPKIFVQNISLRLTPEGSVFRQDDGQPSLYAPGHGDLPEALVRSGFLDEFLSRGGRYIWITNIDNLGASIDPVILGWHIQHGAPLSVEVVDKVGSDKGGIPVRWKNRPVILEEFRLPRDFDPTTVRVFNTNTFIADARALRDLQMDFTWVQVKKKVEGRDAVQFERLIGEITAALDTRFLRLPRTGSQSRFIPVKDKDELENRREEMALVASSRMMLPG